MQALWVRHALKLETSRFDKSAYEAIRESINNWGRFDRFSFISQKMDLPPPPPPQYVYSKGSNSAEPPKSPNQVITAHRIITAMDVDSIQHIVKHPHTVTRIVQSDSEFVYFEDIDTLLHNINFEYEVHWLPEESEEPEVEVYTDEDERVIILSKKRDSMEYTLNQLEIKVETEKAKLIEKKLEQFNQNMEEWVVEYSFDANQLLDDFPNGNLDSLLDNSLNSRGIDLPFEYQVIQQYGDTTKIYSSNQIVPGQLSKPFKADLFPDNYFRKNMYLLVSFPSKSTYLYKSLIVLISGSVVFTLVILTTFWFTIFYMLRQKKVSQIKTDFINNMTHEFKTPIATIGLATDALSSPKVFGQTDPTNYYLGIIRQENKRMNNQVEKVLQMALMEKGNLQIEPEWIDAHQVIKHTVEILQLTAQQKQGHITTVLRAACSFLHADEVHFANLMNNLLDNAIKYTEKSPEIIVETYNHADQLIIRVADNGMGMTKEVQRHIFDQFYRKPTGNIHNIKGFGLGLSYVKAIVSAHDGAIEVTSEPGHGSIFTLSFKCQKV
jgi:signal transduction histidine kinase